MSNSNMVVIGNRIKEIIESLLLEVASEDDHESQEWVSRQWTIPSVSFRKRKSGRGREDGTMRINEGITIVPLGSISSPGTNGRDGVGYQFLVALVQGSFTDTVSGDWPLPIWEQAIRRRFHNNRMGNMSLSNACELRTSVQAGSLPDGASLSDSMDAAFLTITEFVRESRRS